MFAVAISAPLQAAVILQYHHIDSDTPASTSTDPELFAQHLEIIEQQNFTVVSLPELLAAPPAVNTKDRRVAITFDDGYDSVYRQAFPLLKQRGWPFTVFVNTRPLDENWRGFSTWEQLREMARHGASIANHTVSHAHLLARLDGEDDSQWRQRITQDIQQAEARIFEETGQSHRILAYPFGEYDAQLKQLVAELGYQALGQHSGAWAGIHSSQAIPRFPFGGPYGKPAEFTTKLKAVGFPISQVEVQDQAGRPMDTRVTKDSVSIEQTVVLRLSEKVGPAQCFGPGKVSVEQTAEHLLIRLEGKVPVGRSRINCTASAVAGRFHWYSQPFFRPDENGRWLD